MSIQVLKPKFEIDECLDAVRECLEKGWTGMGLRPYSLRKHGRNIQPIKMPTILIPIP